MAYRTDVAHDSQPHDDGAVHAHVSSVAFYVTVFMGLLFLTGLTVGQSYVDLGKLNLFAVILIATLKASLVVTFFMHLKWDNKFNALVFVSTLFFIGVFFTYTMNDTDRRGDLDPDQNMKIWQKTDEPAPGGMEKKEPHTASSTVGTDHAPPGTPGAPGVDPHNAAPPKQH